MNKVVTLVTLKMGETLGIAHNVFEKMEREKDRKERLKKYEEWLKDQEKRKTRLKDIQARSRSTIQNSKSNLSLCRLCCLTMFFARRTP